MPKNTKSWCQRPKPVADFDDRNAIYAMRDNIINLGLHDHRQFLREQVLEEMERLLEKYPNGIEGYETGQPRL